MAPAPPRASATAPAFSAPAVISHTSVAAAIAGKVSVSRVGGGFGQPRTATTERLSYAAGDSGKIDATCPSSPTPSMSTSNRGTGPWSSGRVALASSAAYAAAAASGSPAY